MNTKTRQPEAQSSPQPVCRCCEQPIMPGPEFAEEAKAGLHRQCFRSDVHQHAITSRAHEIWLTAFGALFCGLPQSRIALVDLFKGYRKPEAATLHGYLECLHNALNLIKHSSLSEDNRSALTDKVNDALAEIKRLTVDGAN